MTQTSTAARLTPGTHAVVTVPMRGTWVGDIESGTPVTIVEWDAADLDPGDDYVADLGGGRLVSFPAANLAPAMPVTVSVTHGTYTVTLTALVVDGPITDDHYWTEQWSNDGQRFGDCPATRLRGEDPVAYARRAARGLAEARG